MNAKDLHTWLLHTSGSKYVTRKLGICQFSSADQIEKLEIYQYKRQDARNRRSSTGDISLFPAFSVSKSRIYVITYYFLAFPTPADT